MQGRDEDPGLSGDWDARVVEAGRQIRRTVWTWLLVAIAMAGLWEAAVYPLSPYVTTARGCRLGYPLANVYLPWRLKLLSACVEATGTIVDQEHASDGDTHLDLAPDPLSMDLLVPGNVGRDQGALILEIVPADRQGILLLPVGSHVRAVGPLVYDRLHGWIEIHPLWRLELLR